MSVIVIVRFHCVEVALVGGPLLVQREPNKRFMAPYNKSDIDQEPADHYSRVIELRLRRARNRTLGTPF